MCLNHPELVHKHPAYTPCFPWKDVVTLGAHAQRGYGSWVVCLAFIRSTNDATYLAGNEVENICAILSETSPLQTTGIVRLTSAAAIFPWLGTRLRTIIHNSYTLVV